jgi:hypothetical protein
MFDVLFVLLIFGAVSSSGTAFENWFHDDGEKQSRRASNQGGRSGRHHFAPERCYFAERCASGSGYRLSFITRNCRPLIPETT